MRRYIALLALGLSVHWSIMGCQSARRPHHPVPASYNHSDSKSVVAEFGKFKGDPLPSSNPSPPNNGSTSDPSRDALPEDSNSTESGTAAPILSLPILPDVEPRTPPKTPADAVPLSLPPVLPSTQGETKPIATLSTLSVTPPTPVAAARNGIIILSGKMDPPAAATKPPVPATVARPNPALKGTTMTGHVEFWRNTRRLRYAGVEIDDPHGGSIALVGDNLSKLQVGQHVRVQGQVLPPDEQDATRRFLVQSLQVVE